MKDVRLRAHEMFAVSPDGRHLVWPDGKVLNLRTGTRSSIDLGGEFYPVNNVNVRRIRGMKFAPNGKRLAVLINDIDAKPSPHPRTACTRSSSMTETRESAVP